MKIYRIVPEIDSCSLFQVSWKSHYPTHWLKCFSPFVRVFSPLIMFACMCVCVCVSSSLALCVVHMRSRMFSLSLDRSVNGHKLFFVSADNLHVISIDFYISYSIAAKDMIN